MTSGQMPLLDYFLKSGMDTLIGVDPVQGKGADLKLLREKLGGKICLWGGVNRHLTIDRGTEREVEEAVEESISILGPNGFILSIVDGIGDCSEHAWNNVKTMIKAWKRKLRALDMI